MPTPQSNNDPPVHGAARALFTDNSHAQGNYDDEDTIFKDTAKLSRNLNGCARHAEGFTRDAGGWLKIDELIEYAHIWAPWAYSSYLYCFAERIFLSAA